MYAYKDHMIVIQQIAIKYFVVASCDGLSNMSSTNIVSNSDEKKEVMDSQQHGIQEDTPCRVSHAWLDLFLAQALSLAV